MNARDWKESGFYKWCGESNLGEREQFEIIN